jgi:hypothetical protein
VVQDWVFLGDFDLTALTQHALVWIVESNTDLLWNDCSSSQNSQIVQNGLSVVTEGWGLDSTHLETGLDLVHDQVGQWLALNVISDNQKWSLLFHGILQKLEDLLEWGDFVFGDKDQRLFELGLLWFLVVNEVRWNVASVKLESLNEFNLMLKGLALTDGDNTSVTNLLEKISKFLTDFFISVSRNRSDWLDLRTVFNFDWVLGDFLDDCLNCQIDTFLHFAKVDSSFDSFQSLSENGSGQDRGGGGSISSLVIGLVGNGLNETGTHVGKSIAELNGLSNSDTVLGDFDSTEGLVDQNVTSVWSKSDLDSICQSITALQHFVSGIVTKKQFFWGKVESESVEEERSEFVDVSVHGDEVVMLIIKWPKI